MQAVTGQVNVAVCKQKQSAQKDLMAMIRQLGLATLFVTLSAAETRWPHLLKLLAHINYNRQLTDEQCHHLSWGENADL
jgi:hypothetical protein